MSTERNRELQRLTESAAKYLARAELFLKLSILFVCLAIAATIIRIVLDA